MVDERSHKPYLEDMATLNSFDGGMVRWLDDNSRGMAKPERGAHGEWLGTFTVYTKNPVTGGTREDRGAILGMHIEVVA